MVRVLDAKTKDLRTVSGKVKAALSQEKVTLSHATHLDGLCGGLKEGDIVIDGDAGNYLGVLNDGANIQVQGNAGRYLGDNMTAGQVIVEGNADYGAGPYCYGGTVVVKGNSGDFTAVMNKGANIIIGGDVGDEAATYMLAGDLVIAGNAGMNLGNYLIRGSIYIGGDWKSLGHNTRLAEMTAADQETVRRYLDRYGIDGDPATFRKIVRLSEKPFYKSKPEVQREHVRLTPSLA